MDSQVIDKQIIIEGAEMHNLKNIDLSIPKKKLVVVTGLSGSGKSSLAFDTIYAEGQRRFIESLSSYTRQFLGKLTKPKIKKISGLSPAIAIEQRVNNSTILEKLVEIGGWALVLVFVGPMIIGWILPGPLERKKKS